MAGGAGTAGAAGNGNAPLPPEVAIPGNTTLHTGVDVSWGPRLVVQPQYDPTWNWDEKTKGTMSYVTDKGSPIEALIHFAPSTKNPGYFDCVAKPAVELKPDTWYRFRIEPKDFLLKIPVEGVLQLPDDMPFEHPFFTGSAPMVRFASYEANPTSLRLMFSEDVEMATLVDSIEVLLDGVSIGGCALEGDLCISKGAVGQLPGTWVMLDKPLTGNIVVKLSPSIKGQSRTFGEAAGLVGATIGSDGKIELPMAFEQLASGPWVWFPPAPAAAP